MLNDNLDQERAARSLALTTAEARRWARLAKLTNDVEGRAFCEAQAASYYGQAARWEAQASVCEVAHDR